MQGLPPFVRVTSVDSRCEWTENGLKFAFTLITNSRAPALVLEHVVPIDLREIKQFLYRNSFLEQYHLVHERLKALHDVATDADLKKGIQDITCSGHEGMCVVCQMDFEEGEAAVKLRACDHIFHGECIQGWLLGCSAECPVCRVPISTEPLPVHSPQHNNNNVDPPQVPEAQMQAGTEVVIFGLIGSPQHNGRSGVVQEWHEERGRYSVRCPARNEIEDEVLLALKPQNVMVVQVVGEQPATTTAAVSVGVPDEWADTEEDDGTAEADLAEALRLSMEGMETIDEPNDSLQCPASTTCVEDSTEQNTRDSDEECLDILDENSGISDDNEQEGHNLMIQREHEARTRRRSAEHGCSCPRLC